MLSLVWSPSPNLVSKAPASRNWHRSGWFALLTLALCACSDEFESPAANSGDSADSADSAESAGQGPFARSFLPYEEKWRPLATVPTEPQESPEMVIWEVSDFPDGAQPSKAQQAAADEFVERCYRAALRNGWLDFDKAIADGFLALFQDRRHYGSWEFASDGVLLDPERPEFLMYYASPAGMRLIGFMFYTNELLGRGPQFGGPLTRWHYHIWKTATCLRDNLLPIGQALESGRCLVGDVSHRSPEMIHVWLVDREEGPFFTGMYMAPERLGAMLEKRTEERGKPW